MLHSKKQYKRKKSNGGKLDYFEFNQYNKITYPSTIRHYVHFWNAFKNTSFLGYQNTVCFKLPKFNLLSECVKGIHNVNILNVLLSVLFTKIW